VETLYDRKPRAELGFSVTTEEGEEPPDEKLDKVE